MFENKEVLIYVFRIVFEYEGQSRMTCAYGRLLFILDFFNVLLLDFSCPSRVFVRLGYFLDIFGPLSLLYPTQSVIHTKNRTVFSLSHGVSHRL